MVCCFTRSCIGYSYMFLSKRYKVFPMIFVHTASHARKMPAKNPRMKLSIGYSITSSEDYLEGSKRNAMIVKHPKPIAHPGYGVPAKIAATIKNTCQSFISLFLTGKGKLRPIILSCDLCSVYFVSPIFHTQSPELLFRPSRRNLYRVFICYFFLEGME